MQRRLRPSISFQGPDWAHLTPSHLRLLIATTDQHSYGNREGSQYSHLQFHHRATSRRRNRALYEIGTMSMGEIRRYVHVHVCDKDGIPRLGVLGIIWIRYHEDSEDKAVGTSNEIWHSCYARKVDQRRGYQTSRWLSRVAILMTTHATSIAVETSFMTCFYQQETSFTFQSLLRSI